jgi:hypothetical protein
MDEMCKMEGGGCVPFVIVIRTLISQTLEVPSIGYHFLIQEIELVVRNHIVEYD